MPLGSNPLSLPFAACSVDHWQAALGAIIEESDSYVEIAAALEKDVEGALIETAHKMRAAQKGLRDALDGMLGADRIAKPDALSDAEIRERVQRMAGCSRLIAAAALTQALILNTLEEWSQIDG